MDAETKSEATIGVCLSDKEARILNDWYRSEGAKLFRAKYIAQKRTDAIDALRRADDMRLLGLAQGLMHAWDTLLELEADLSAIVATDPAEIAVHRLDNQPDKMLISSGH